LRFSDRSGFDLTPNRLSRLVQAKRRAGASLIDLTQSNPTEAGLSAAPDVLAALTDPRSLRYQPDARGLVAAREAVAGDFARRGHALDADRILLTASTSEAYGFLFKLLCDPGDTVLVPRPSYPLFEFLARLENVRTAFYDLDYDGEWHVSIEKLAAAIPERARAIVVVNPNNPTGQFLKRDEAEAIEALCAARSLALISDEVFADYAFGDDPRRVTSLARDGAALSFALGGLSKSCALPQLKLGWIAVTGPPAPRQSALERLEIIADSYLSVGTPVQHAAAGLLARLPELQDPVQSRVQANRGALQRAVHGSAVTLLGSEGGWCAILKMPRTVSEEDRVLGLLERHDVLVHPGFFFDFPSEAYLVLSLLPPEEVFSRGISLLIKNVK